MLCVKMDDLDHSMLVAENDWMRFFEESEECSLLQPSLACLDGPAVSVSEDSRNPDSVFKTNQHEAQQSTDGDESQSGDAGGHRWTGYTNQSGGPEDITIETKEASVVRNHVAQVDSEICLDDAAENEAMHVENAEQISEVTNDGIANAQRTEPTNVECSSVSASAELKKGDGHVQTEGGSLNLKSIQEPDPPSCNEAGINENVPHTAERAEGTSCVTTRPEKERWFVTVNDSPVRNRTRAPSVKKKRRQKKLRKDKRACGREREPRVQRGSGLEIDNMKDKSEGENDNEHCTKSDQNSGGQPNAEISLENMQSELISDSLQMHIKSLPSAETDDVAQKLEMSQSLKAESIESRVDGDKCEPCSSVEKPEKPTDSPTPTPPDTFTLPGEESDEFEDHVEFFSIHSYDSENYLSAAESLDEPQHLLTEQLYFKCISSLTTSNGKLFDLTDGTDADNFQHGEMHSCDTHKENFNSIVPAASDCEGYESIADGVHVEPSAGQGTNKKTEDNPACQRLNNLSHVPFDTSELQKHNSPAGCGISASNCLEKDQFKLPDLTVTPCSEVDGPETYAEAVGPARPVFAISAFWDEMEKLTIKDILQLRMDMNPSTMEAHSTAGTARANVDVTDAPAHSSSLADAVEYRLADGSLMDASDAADSDYFTQPDESKPDRSSCEFSAFSDCEEEYLRFISASRNPSPDPQNKNQQSQSTNDFLAQDSQEECPSPASVEEITEPCFDDHASHTPVSSDLLCPRRISKCRSMQNVQALNSQHPQEDFLLKSNAEDSLFLRNCQSLEQNTSFKVSDSLGALTAASILTSIDIVNEHYKITFPEVLQCLFAEDEVKNNCRSVMVYDPKEVSVYDYTVCTSMHEMPVSSEGKPIPIFSCSPPTVRDLTFPEVDYLFFSQNACAETYEVSPNKVVACPHLHANDFASSAAAAAAAANGPLYEKHWARGWKSFLSIGNIRFHDKGSMWYRRSGGWVFPAETERKHITRAVPAITVFSEGRVHLTPSQIFRELAVEQSILETIHTTFSLTKREGLFSMLKQSDMCLVCIAVASWVLKSTDLEGADGWKAALLANVSALSAIQYLRQYLKKDPPQDKP